MPGLTDIESFAKKDLGSSGGRSKIFQNVWIGGQCCSSPCLENCIGDERHLIEAKRLLQDVCSGKC
jgi:hypothetical protein